MTYRLGDFDPRVQHSWVRLDLLWIRRGGSYADACLFTARARALMIRSMVKAGQTRSVLKQELRKTLLPEEWSICRKCNLATTTESAQAADGFNQCPPPAEEIS